MKMNAWLCPVLAVVFASFAPLHAADTVAVKGDRINVRGQAALAGEVITQLRKGESVAVLELIHVAKPKTNEPAIWAKIALPTNTPVWINATFIDPEKKTVNTKRLNIRSGPGENFSVIGRLDKGATVKEIRTVESWMEIEAPEGCYAFVAGDRLDLPKDGKLATPEAPAPTVVKNTPPPAAKPAEPPPITVVETVKAEPPPAPVVDTKPEVKKPEPPPAPKPVEPPPVVEKPVPPPTPPAPVVVPPPITEPAPAPPAATDANVPRIVTREGIVRRTISIQAPTSYRLADPDTDKTINYLYPADTGLQLKYYSGQRIRITGPESTDKRWPNTPLIEIKTLEPLP